MVAESAILAVEEGAIEDGGADEVRESFEAGTRSGGGDEGFFFVGEADVDLGGSFHETGGLRRGQTCFEHRRDGDAQGLLRSLEAFVRRVAIGENSRHLDG